MPEPDRSTKAVRATSARDTEHRWVSVSAGGQGSRCARQGWLGLRLPPSGRIGPAVVSRRTRTSGNVYRNTILSVNPNLGIGGRGCALRASSALIPNPAGHGLVGSCERLQRAIDLERSRHLLITRDSGFYPTQLAVDPGIQEILSAVAADENRTQRIAGDIAAELTEDRYPLVLTERRDHLDAIAELLEAETDRIVVPHGGMGVKARRRAGDILCSDGPRVVLATGRYIGEGFDDPRLDTLMLAMPIAWKGTMTQYAGRLHRHHDTKHEIRIVDYVDHAVSVLRRMYAKRQRAYSSLGYATG